MSATRKKTKTIDASFVYLFAAYASGLVIANAMGAKLMAFGPWLLSVGTIAYPLTFVLQDVINETYGAKASHIAVRGAAVALMCLATLSAIATNIHDPQQPLMDESFDSLFGAAPRIVFASMVAFIIGGIVDTSLFFRIKNKLPEQLVARKLGSTIVSQLIDTVLFVGIAFGGTMPADILLSIGVGQYLLKQAAAVCSFPVTYLALRIYR